MLCYRAKATAITPLNNDGSVSSRTKKVDTVVVLGLVTELDRCPVTVDCARFRALISAYCYSD